MVRCRCPRRPRPPPGSGVRFPDSPVARGAVGGRVCPLPLTSVLEVPGGRAPCCTGEDHWPS
eukprot:2745368-Prymnesium_polylepis.1